MQRGLSNIYLIKCCKCSIVKKVYTNQVFDYQRGLFTINAKAAAGSLDAGIGESQLNSLLTSMNIETVSSALLKRYERKIGKCIEEVAIESCSQSLEEEKTLAQSANYIVLDTHRSLLGHGVLMGHYSKKIFSYATRSKNCRKCRLGHDKSDHDCRMNYDGSAKSMEADMAVKLYIKNPLFAQHDVFGARIIMDNDWSTIATLP
uniref:Mutator-like transposase domain-containing protein n=1 Tax=Trichogramma kaykai TaxID=54128 RepID=A0ABD2WA33_9HYME